jgi:hypothetical protein
MADERIVYPLKDVGKVAGGRALSTVHAAKNLGLLETYIAGGRRYATREAINKWLALEKKASDDGRPISYRPRSGEKAREADSK